MVNLRALLRSRLTEDVFLAVREKHGVEFSVLVCDDSTTKLVSSCFRVHEVNDLGVGTVLNIGYEREQLPNTPAIYLIRPTKENILRLIQDFEGKQRTYRRAFLFTTGPLEEALFEKLAESAAADYLGEFIELRLDFVAFESRVALLGRTGAISTLYLPRTERDKLVEMERSVEQLVSLCLALKEYPYVRFQEAGNAISRSIAENFEALMQRSIRNLKDFQYCENRATLLIVDRSLDPVAPLMHEYSYQAMINDLLPCEGEMVNLKQQPSNGEESGPLVLSNEEELWDSLRHQHISEVTKAVISQLDDFRKQNAIAKSKGNQDTKDLLAMAKALPQYREEMRKFSKHMKLAEACFDAFDSQKLREISSLEQDMATGVDENGKKTSRTELQHRLVGFIQDDQIQLSDKLRLLMIYIITQDGIESNTRKQLFNAGKFSEAHEESILNLSQLGITLQNV